MKVSVRAEQSLEGKEGREVGGLAGEGSGSQKRVLAEGPQPVLEGKNPVLVNNQLLELPLPPSPSLLRRKKTKTQT